MTGGAEREPERERKERRAQSEKQEPHTSDVGKKLHIVYVIIYK